MSNDTTELPLFESTAPAALSNPEVSAHLFTEVLERLAAVVDLDTDQLDRPTPCAQFDVGQLRNHVLGWLQFFAASFADPGAASPRPDADAFALTDGERASVVVAKALAGIHRAIADGVAGEIVTMSSARMGGDSVLAMALGEYIIHAWDLARATGQPYEGPDAAIGPAHEFLRSTVAPEYRGPDSGFFDGEVGVPEGASALDALLGFAGRDPAWAPGN
jgi:uncharacterized protein (TIGR03086 family)